MEPCRDSAGREHAAAPPVWPSQPARAIWWILVRQNDENRSISFSVLVFCGILTKRKRDAEMKKIALVLAVYLLTGCVSRPYESTQVIYDNSLITPDSNSTKVRIHRVKQFAGSGLGEDCPLVLKVDDKEVVGLQQNQYVDIYIPTGMHVLSVRFKCALTSWHKSVALTADGKYQEYETEVGPAGQYRMWKK